MPISVLCPSCDAQVNAPDSAAGKRAKCPKCHELMILPGGESETVEEPVPKRTSRRVDEDDESDRPRRSSRSRRDEEDDFEDDDRPRSRRRNDVEDDYEDTRPSRRSRRREDEDDEVGDVRPRRRKRSKASAGPPVGLLIGGGIGLLLVVVGGLYLLLGGSKESKDDFKNPVIAANNNPQFAGGGGFGAGGRRAVPPGWITFHEPNGNYTAIFPVRPDNLPVPNPAPILIDQIKLNQAMSVDGRLYQVVHQIFREEPPANQPAFLDQVCDGFSNSVRATFGRELSRTGSNIGNIRAKELTFNSGTSASVVRLAVSGRKMFAVSVIIRENRVPNDELAKAYFDNFQPK